MNVHVSAGLLFYLLRVSKNNVLSFMCCVGAARGATSVRAKNGALREELGAAQYVVAP